MLAFYATMSFTKRKQKQVHNAILPFCQPCPLPGRFHWAAATLWESRGLSVSVYHRWCCISPERNAGMNYTGAYPPYPLLPLCHIPKQCPGTACIGKWIGASPSSGAELFAFFPLCLIEGEKPAKQMNAAFKITILKQGWKVQTSWADFHREEREASSGHFLLLPSAFSCPGKVWLSIAASRQALPAWLPARPWFRGQRSPVSLLSSSQAGNNSAGKVRGPSAWEPATLSVLRSYKKPTQRCLAQNPPPKHVGWARIHCNLSHFKIYCKNTLSN